MTRRTRHRVSMAVAGACSMLVVAGCGSASKPSGARQTPASVATRSGGANNEDLPAYERMQLKAAACIRAHGVPKLPDPTFGAGGASVNMSTPAGMMTSTAFYRAAKECAKLGLELAGYAPTLHATAAQMAKALAIAKCMRAHGVPNWPDPTTTRPSNLKGYGVRGAVPGPAGGPIFVIPDSIDIEAPTVKRALHICHDD